MNGPDLVPAAVAAGAGAALLGGLAAHERRTDAAMRAERSVYMLTFPIATEVDAALRALNSLSGIDRNVELVCEVVASEDGISHLLHLPQSVATSVIDQLSAAMPGIRVEPVEPRVTGAVTATARVNVAVHALLHTDGAEQASRAVLEGLAALSDGERVSLRWAVRPAVAPKPPVKTAKTSTPVSLHARARERAIRARLGQPGFTCSGLVLVRAGSASRARELVSHVVAVMRSRNSLGHGLVIRRGAPRTNSVMPSTGRSRGWLASSELLPLLAWPIGPVPVAGVEMGAARRIRVPRGVAREGRVIFIGGDAYGPRPVAQTVEAATRHTAYVGPSGVGKSTAMANAILSDIARGFGGVVIDPKADLVADVLDGVRPQDAERIVVLDPAASGPVPGLDLLGVGDADLRADVVLGVLVSVFKDAWGVRSDHYGRLGLRTLTELPSPVLSDWLRLFTDPAFRHQAVGRLRDPLLRGAWASYEAMSPAQQQEHLVAPMTKVLGLLSRPAVRNVLSQRDPKLDIARLLAEGKWLLVPLSPGAPLGEPAARLLGAVVMFMVWTAIEARAAIPRERRRPVFLHVDELQSLTALPFGIEHLFERARGLGCGVTVATQALGRLPDSVRTALLGNASTLVTFRLGYDEAVRVGRELPGLTAADLQALRRFEVAARVGTGAGSSVAVMTGKTDPLGPVTGQAALIRRLSAERYGGTAADLDADVDPAAEALDESPVGRTRRSS